ncbi:MAG: monofunctional biosynthetic peptidoglycan transglycosylase [Alphaproteobacteria bacterium]|nr:monofunctional biosynthetic peptidoglycan transglycosylase [Alphaproteobacteria bacterium]
MWNHDGREGVIASKKKRGLGRRIVRLLAGIVLAVLLVPVALILVYRVVPPPVTPLMLIRSADGYGIRKQWTGLDRISPALQRAVIASEDAKFCEHNGFDWASLEDSVDDLEEGKRARGASTISMQTAKNLFLWPARSFVRKGAEAYITMWLELLWPKQRILEVYLNIIEWGKGIYGAQTAAETYFGIPAAGLNSRQAALMAVALPTPRKSNPGRPSSYLSSRAGVIQGRMGSVPFGRSGVCP